MYTSTDDDETLDGGLYSLVCDGDDGNRQTAECFPECLVPKYGGMGQFPLMNVGIELGVSVGDAVGKGCLVMLIGEIIAE